MKVVYWTLHATVLVVPGFAVTWQQLLSMQPRKVCQKLTYKIPGFHGLREVQRLRARQWQTFFLPKRAENRATSRSVMKEDKAFLYNALKEVSSQTRLQWIIGPDPPAFTPKDPLEPYVIEDLLQEFLNDKEMFTEKARFPEVR